MVQKETIEVRYTDSGEKKMEEVLQEFGKRIERKIKKRKFVPGKEYIEITSSDIEKIYSQYRFAGSKNKKKNTHYTFLYFILGLISITLAFVKDPLIWLLDEPEKPGDMASGILIIAGSISITVSVIRYYYLNIKEKEAKAERERKQMKS